MITKPMLANKVKDMDKIQYPVYATPKLDGIRALMIAGKLVSRTYKPIPNVATRNFFESFLPDNVDGELILAGDKPCGAGFGKTTSAVMKQDGEPELIYHIFDYVRDDLNKPYLERIADIIKLLDGESRVNIVIPIEIKNEEELIIFEEKCILEGYEGIMIRTGNSPYKCGRATEREGYLLKVKRFEDAEARIVDILEQQHNENEAIKDAFGRTKRSTKGEGKVNAGVMGKILVEGQYSIDGVMKIVQFKIGTGFNDEDRKEFWDNKDKYIGKFVKYKHQPSGGDESPRFPVYLGIRHEDDMG